MAGPILSVQVGMGEPILILTPRGDRDRRHRLDPRRVLAALLVGIVDTLGRAFLPICCASSCRRIGAAPPGRRSRRC
jgi:branched-chain amino acid transport system permease protein